jgi:hypothetical protein
MFIVIQYKSDLLEFFGADDDSDISFNVGRVTAIVVDIDDDRNSKAKINAFIFFLSFKPTSV